MPSPLGVATVMPMLIHRGSDEVGLPAARVFFDSSDPDFSHRLALQWLEEQGFVEEMSQDLVSTTWRMTRTGLQRLRIHAKLEVKGPALWRREHIDPAAGGRL